MLHSSPCQRDHGPIMLKISLPLAVFHLVTGLGENIIELIVIFSNLRSAQLRM